MSKAAAVVKSEDAPPYEVPARDAFIHNLALARPHYFTFATTGLGGGSSSIGLLPPLTIPGASYGLNYGIRIAVPRIDFFKQDVALPPPLASSLVSATIFIASEALLLPAAFVTETLMLVVICAVSALKRGEARDFWLASSG